MPTFKLDKTLKEIAVVATVPQVTLTTNTQQKEKLSDKSFIFDTGSAHAFVRANKMCASNDDTLSYGSGSLKDTEMFDTMSLSDSSDSSGSGTLVGNRFGKAGCINDARQVILGSRSVDSIFQRIGVDGLIGVGCGMKNYRAQTSSGDIIPYYSRDIPQLDDKTALGCSFTAMKGNTFIYDTTRDEICVGSRDECDTWQQKSPPQNTTTATLDESGFWQTVQIDNHDVLIDTGTSVTTPSDRGCTAGVDAIEYLRLDYTPIDKKTGTRSTPKKQIAEIVENCGTNSRDLNCVEYKLNCDILRNQCGISSCS
jgi:hypothetical protein